MCNCRREPFAAPKLIINPDIKSLQDLETWVTLADFGSDRVSISRSDCLSLFGVIMVQSV